MAYPYPPFDTWQGFETFCRDFFELYWSAQSAQIVGRQGQAQHGVDVLVMMPGMRWRAVQCKQKLDGQLTRAEMRSELDATAELNVSLEHYVFATTAPRDGKVQAWARELAATVDFPITVFAWHDVCEALKDIAYQDLIAKHFPEITLVRPAESPTHPAEALHTFRREHWSELLPLPSLAQARGQRHQDLLLTDVYTALDVESIVMVKATSDDDPPLPRGHANTITLPGDRDYLGRLIGHERALLDRENADDTRQRRCRALEAAAANRRLVLVGKPGSGKSTFGRFLVACLLGESLGRGDSNLARLEGTPLNDFVAWPHGAPLAIFVSLQKFHASASFPASGDSGEARHLTGYLEGLGPGGGLFGGALREALRAPDGCLVVLDGLDETPAAKDAREKLKGVISGFVRAYPDCRVLVTSRPYAYETGSSWRLDDADFASVELAAFDTDQQTAFIEAWYRRLVARKLLDVTEERRRAMSDDLGRQIRTTDYLAPLATSPLMLTMMADLHASNGGRLPTGGRSALYAESVALLLDRWNETRDGDQPSEDLGMSLDTIQEALQALAFKIHRSHGLRDDKPPEIQRAEVWEALVNARDENDQVGLVDDRRIMDYLHQRSGILLGESPTIYRFPHRSYQEYLAAAHLMETDFPDLLGEVVSENPELWREVVLLAVGQVKPFMAWVILETLVPSSPPIEELALDDPRFLHALLAGLAILEHKLSQKLAAASAEKCERIRLWLRRAVEVGALDVQDRARAGQVLGLLGDDRPGVGLGGDALPEIEWVEIPAGSFIMGAQLPTLYEHPCRAEFVEGFRISRYPLTNAQFEPFVKAGGYTERQCHCWTDAGWEWRQAANRQGSPSNGYPFDLPNHPRVSVCWYEAVAFCRWLAEKTGIAYRLPTEAEWERAARSTDAREYPWGALFDSSLCNTVETGFGTTTAVGIFPGGASPHGENGSGGVLDASGNIMEWCSTRWRTSYNKPANDALDGSTVRVLRGGSFADSSFNARCTYRGWGDSDLTSRNVGFRLVCALANQDRRGGNRRGGTAAR